MYSIYADNTCIYNDTYISDDMDWLGESSYISTAATLIDPVLTMEDSAAGSLEMTLPPGNVGYSWIQRMTTEITVKKDGSEIWSGRVLSESTDFGTGENYIVKGSWHI